MRLKQLFAGILISSFLLSTGSGCSKKTKSRSNIATIDQAGNGNAIYELASVKNGKTEASKEELKEAYSEFVFEMIHRCAENAGDSNFMVSTDSMLFALEMTAAGADGETLDQMLGTLMPGVNKEDAFVFASDRMDQIESSQLKIGNSIWINSDFESTVYSNYLKYVEKYFGAQINGIPFNGSGVDQINSWVKDNTNDMIPQMVDRLDPTEVMMLINAIAFDAKWDEKFLGGDIKEDYFCHYSSDSFEIEDMQKVTMLWGEDDVTYLSNYEAKGFYKLYKGKKYAFVTILPDNRSADINEFVANMTAQDYWSFWNSSNDEEIKYCFPKFTSEYEVSLNEILKEMGMPDAFEEDKANFGNMSNLKTLYISKVIQKTKIEVDAVGTKASAATRVSVEHNDAGGSGVAKRSVCCDRPFAYAIVDVETGLPIFFGTVDHVE